MGSALPKTLLKELKPVTLYLEDLHWIETELLNLTIQGQIIFDINQKENSKQLIRMVKRKLDEEQQKKLDILKIEYGKCVVHFDKHGTIIQFEDLREKSKIIFYRIIDYLKPKQRPFPFLKQSLNFTERPKGNFFTQEKMPVWLILIMFILGGVVTKLGEMLIEALKKIIK